ncbi:MAG: hypothetical protein IPL87_04325 [Candidatus Moraniibacteriota bacterium]|nr:MAG: hypothetical protein IPL87_04325 [Candidatus Moranbacteria bacterium]
MKTGKHRFFLVSCLLEGYYNEVALHQTSVGILGFDRISGGAAETSSPSEYETLDFLK